MKDDQGWTPLHLAAHNGHLAVCDFILQNAMDINPKDSEGWTPLHSAAQKGHMEVYNFLLGKIEDKNPIDSHGITPFDLIDEIPENLKSAVMLPYANLNLKSSKAKRKLLKTCSLL